MLLQIVKFVSSVNSSFSKEVFSQLLLSLIRKAFPNYPIKSGYLITILPACLISFKELNTDIFLCICLLSLLPMLEYKFLEKETLSVLFTAVFPAIWIVTGTE